MNAKKGFITISAIILIESVILPAYSLLTVFWNLQIIEGSGFTFLDFFFLNAFEIVVLTVLFFFSLFVVLGIVKKFFWGYYLGIVFFIAKLLLISFVLMQIGFNPMILFTRHIVESVIFLLFYLISIAYLHYHKNYFIMEEPDRKLGLINY